MVSFQNFTKGKICCYRKLTCFWPALSPFWPSNSHDCCCYLVEIGNSCNCCSPFSNDQAKQSKAVPVDSGLSKVAPNWSIYPLERVLLSDEIVLQNVQHFDHLTENEDSVSRLLQFGKQFVQEHDFTRALGQSFEVQVVLVVEIWLAGAEKK